MLRPYAAVLRAPGARWPFVASFVGRLPVSMLSLSIIALVEAATGSYATAGVVAAAYALGSGAGGPVQGRLVDRISQPAVIVPATLLCCALLGALTLAVLRGASPTALILLAGGVGLTFPPVGPCMRTLWSWLLRGDPRLESAFALDAVLIEVVFISGPVLVGAVLSLAGTTAPMVVTGGLLLAGGLAFASTRTAREWRGAASRHAARAAAAAAEAAPSEAAEREAAEREAAEQEAAPQPALPAAAAPALDPPGRAVGLGPLRAPGLRVLIGSMVLTAVAYGVWNVSFSAFTVERGAPGLIGILFTAAAGGSLLGGLWYGSRSWTAPLPRRYLVLLVAFAVCAVPLGLAGTIPQLCVLLFVACLWIAPSGTVGARLVDALAPPGTGTEAYTLVSTADVLGVAIGSSVAGVVVEVWGTAAALSLSAVGIGLGAALVAVRRADLATAETVPVA